MIWRYRDPEHYLALELTPREVRLSLRLGSEQYVLASTPYTKADQQPHWVQVLDDGQALNISLDGQALFCERPLLEPRLGSESGVGVAGQAADLEVHPRQITLPAALSLGKARQAKGRQIAFAPYLNHPAKSLLVSWEPTLGPGILTLAEGGLTIEKSGNERTLYTIP